MTCNWFYETVIQRFREFGSTTVAKSLFGSTYKRKFSIMFNRKNLIQSFLSIIIFRKYHNHYCFKTFPAKMLTIYITSLPTTSL